MAKYEGQLTAGSRALLKKYPKYRLDVYPTHRSVALPDRVLDNTLANATRANTQDGGLSITGAIGGYPFPIPKTGNEAMWNHLLRYVGVASNFKYDNWNVDASGKPALSTSGKLFVEYPYYDPKNTKPAEETDVYFRTKIFYNAPARRAGEALMAVDVVNPFKRPRRAWLYLPGQRRVKLAPDISYDTPNPGTAGAATYDDTWMFNGAMDRFDFKLVGKKEMLVPYNTYRLTFAKKAADVTTPQFLNPDLVRWELHRVWVVEATLKPGKRQIRIEELRRGHVGGFLVRGQPVRVVWHRHFLLADQLEVEAVHGAVEHPGVVVGRRAGRARVGRVVGDVGGELHAALARQVQPGATRPLERVDHVHRHQRLAGAACRGVVGDLGAEVDVSFLRPAWCSSGRRTGIRRTACRWWTAPACRRHPRSSCRT